MEQREFLNMIRVCRRRLNLAGFLKKLVFALSVGAGVGILFQAVSFVAPLYYANVYSAVSVLAAAVTAIVLSLIGRRTMEHAALVMDGFGFQERIITAYEHLKEEGTLFALQREDAMEQLKAHRDKIRIPLWPDWRKMTFLTILLAVMLGLAFVPSRMKERAGELHQIRKEAKEKEKEIEEVLEELEKLEELEQDVLTPEQLAALQEMMESLQSSMTEFQQASSAEALQAAGEKLNYKYENMSSQMSGLARSIQSGATVSPISAESMQAMADKLQEMSGNSSPGGDSLASSQGQNGDGQSGQNGSNQNGDGQSGQNGSNQNGDGQSGQNGSGQDGDGQSGQNGSGQDGDGQNGQNSGQNGNGQNGQGNGQSGQGNGQNGQGNGQNGQGSGQDGQGNGQGNGSGTGQGNATGRGTGTANNPHDYVSIPNAIADSGNLTGNAGNHDDSEYFRAQNGLSWEGMHMSHEAVIGSYERNAYEGIAAGRYPSGMENVIKEYFASFN